MILKDNLYTITGWYKNEEGAIFTIKLNPDCFIYKAHFPEQPITPGVCVTQIAVELTEELLQRPLHMTGAKNIKFMALMVPEPDERMETALDLDVTYSINIKPVDDRTLKIQAEAKNGDVVYAKLSLLAE